MLKNTTQGYESPSAMPEGGGAATDSGRPSPEDLVKKK
jgi:hypothetical protein